MGRRNKESSLTVSEQDVAEVVAMMTRIPVTRVAQTESHRLVKMSDELKGKKLLVRMVR